MNAFIFSLFWGSVVSLLTLGLVAIAPGVFGDIQPKLMSIAVISVPFQLLTLFGLNLLLAMGLVGRLNVLDALAQFLLVINALVLMFTAWLVPGFHLAGFWNAVLISIFISVFSFIVNVILGLKK